MIVYKGRPNNENARLAKEIRVYDCLDSLGIEYFRVDHSEAMTMDDCEKIDVALETVVCKNLVLCNRQHTNFYLLMMPGNKAFKTKELSHQINSSRLSFAEAEYLEEYLDVLPGSVSIMGLMNDKDNHVKLLIDADVLKPDYIGCHPCVNTSSLKIKTKDILEKYLKFVHHEPTIVNLTGEDVSI